MAEQRTTNASGAPVAGDERSLTVGPNGPTPLQGAYVVQQMEHFNRERVLERVAHAKGRAAHGFLEVTIAAGEAPGPRRLGPDCPRLAPSRGRTTRAEARPVLTGTSPSPRPSWAARKPAARCPGLRGAAHAAGASARRRPNDDGYEGLIVAEAIPVNSLCMHDLVPFRGLAHVGSLPGERIIGLSKLARVVERFVRGLQIQERVAVQIADWLQAELRPAGAGVVLEAEPGANAAQTLRHQRFEGRLVLVGTEHERRTSVRGCRRTSCAATPGARASTCTARASYADHDIELHLGRTAVDMKTTLQEIALDVMPQQDDRIPGAGHSLERSAS